MAFMDRFMKAPKEPKRDLHALVLELIGKGLPRGDILGNLVQAGMKAEEAENFYESIRKEHDGLVKSEIGRTIMEASDKSKQDMIKGLEEEVRRMKTDLETEMSLRIAEQKDYTDKKAGAVGAEVEGMKSDLFSFKVDTRGEMRVLEREVEEVRLKGFIRVLLSIVTILAAAVMSLLAVTQLYGAINGGGQDITTLAVYAIVLIGAAIFAWLGANIYLSERKFETINKAGKE